MHHGWRIRVPTGPALPLGWRNLSRDWGGTDNSRGGAEELSGTESVEAAGVRLYSVFFVNLLIEYALFTFSQLSFLAATKTASVT